MDSLVPKMVAVMALSLSLSRCEPVALSNQYGVPGNFAGSLPQGNQYQQQQTVTNSYGAPLADGHGHDEHQDYIDSQPKSYEFGYAVRDAASGNDFGRRETSDGETVRGEYRVQLPDGRTQIVTYTADWRTGFHADVRYEGVAQFPDQYNTANQGYNNNANNNNNNGNNGNNGNNNDNVGNNISGNGGSNTLHNAAYDYAGNNLDSAYNNAQGNRGGYNNYQSAANNYNSGSNYNYQYGSNSIDSGYSSGNSFGPSASPPLSPPQPTYGVPFH